MAKTSQAYLVRLSDRTSGRPLAAASFEDAAFAYVEVCHPPPDGEGEVVLIVREAETGCEQCFRLEIGSGQIEPCDETDAGADRAL